LPEAAFIHTADVNLRESSEQSIPLVRWLLDKCTERNAALLVAGDFFESEDEAARLRSKVREVFAEAPDIAKFILPGNRDAGAYSENADFGPNFHALSNAPFSTAVHSDVHIVGFPFVSGSSLRAQLDDYTSPGKPLVALMHGTYFGKGSHSYFEDVRERAEDFYPIYGSDLEDIGSCYAALGHYHKQHSSFVHKDAAVCYPGTPMALNSGEIGIRTVVAVKINTEAGETDIERIPVPLGTYYTRKDIEIFACSEEKSLADLEEMMQERADKRAVLTIRLKGNIHLLERDMNERLAELRGKYSGLFAKLVLRNETISFRSLIDERPLVRDFMARLAAIEEMDEDTRARALELGLRAFDRAKGYLR